MQVERGCGVRTVHFAPHARRAPVPRGRRLLLGTCLAAAAASATFPSAIRAPEAGTTLAAVRPQAGPDPVEPKAAPAPARENRVARGAATPSRRSDDAERPVVPANWTPELRVALPEPDAGGEPLPAVIAEIPPAPAQPVRVTPPPAVAQRLEAAPLRPVDIEQLAGNGMRSPHVLQLHEPGLVAGAGATLAARIDGMQVRLPAPPRLTGEERAALLAEAPTEMTVRAGDEAVGSVAFRMSGTGAIEVQLSGLLDLVADRLGPEEFGRLRLSAAADSFVPVEQLRAVGLSLQYDPVYDELRLSA